MKGDHGMEPTRRGPIALALILLACSCLSAQEASTEAETHDLAKQSQNPLASLISVPFQNNTNFGAGPNDRTQNILNIQPVIPVTLGKLNLISRAIMPVVNQPDLFSDTGGEIGLGDINYTLWFSPAESGALSWGVGPAIVLPTATDDTLGTGKWSAGPSVVLVTMPGHWVLGTLLSNTWSFAGDSGRADVNSFLWEYFVTYNLPKGWYFTSTPNVTANWEAPRGQRWTVPFGGGFGRVFRIGRQAMNWQLQAFGNAVHPDGGASWTLRLSLTLLFPKRG